MASGILEVLRAAAQPAAMARTGYLKGKREKDDRVESQHRYDEAQKRQGLLDQTRMALEQAQGERERAQAAADTARAGYYDRGGAGKGGALTPKDRAAYIRAKSMPRYNPDTGAMEPGMTATEAAAEFDSIVRPQASSSAPLPAGAAGSFTTPTGKRKYVSGFSQRHPGGVGVPPDESAAQADRVDTNSKTPLTDSLRSGPANPAARRDSIFQRYQLQP